MNRRQRKIYAHRIASEAIGHAIKSGAFFPQYLRGPERNQVYWALSELEESHYAKSEKLLERESRTE